MRIKNCLLISLILLAIIAVGAVGAADIESDDAAIADSGIDEISTADADVVVNDVESPALESSSDADVIAAGDTADVVEAADNVDVVEAADNNDVIEASASKEILDNGGYFDGNNYYVYIRTSYYDMDVNYDDYQVGEVEDEGYVNGVVAFYVDNSQVYSKAYSLAEGKKNVYIYINDLVLPGSITAGLHSVKITYFKAGAPSISQTATVNFYPIVNNLKYMSVGEPNAFRIWAGPGINGAASIYLYDNFISEYRPAGTVNIVNGNAYFPFSASYATTLDYKIGYTINGRMFSEYRVIYVKANSPGYSASVTPSIYVGSTATVTFSGAKTNGDISIYVDGKQVKKSTYFGGTYTDILAGLAVGTHQVTVQYSRGDDFFSQTFNVNVMKKPKKKVSKKTTIKLTAAKTVSKKAKKYVMKAKLRVKGKIGKKKTVTFTFKGKKFKAKTNKKGIAKVTIKKKVLKKLLKKVKAGKKIKVTVKYGKKTAKKTVKVKK